MYPGPVIDIHAHVAFHDDERVGGAHALGAAGLLAEVRGERVRHATAIVIAKAGRPDATRDTNDAVLALGPETGGFLIPVVSVHPADGDAALAELDRVAGRGARMLKLHPNSQAFDVDDPRVATVLTRAGEHGMVTLFDGYSPFDPGQVGKFIKLAAACPGARFILAHMNGPGFAELLAFTVLAKYPWWGRQVYFDVSATAPMLAGGPYAEQFAWVVRQLGTDRVLYGSDWPLVEPDAALDAVHRLGFSDDEERAILHDTAAALLGV